MKRKLPVPERCGPDIVAIMPDGQIVDVDLMQAAQQARMWADVVFGHLIRSEQFGKAAPEARSDIR